MRLEDLFRNLGTLAATLGSQTFECGIDGVPLEELNLTGKPPRRVTLSGSAQVAITHGETFHIDVQPGVSDRPVRFTLEGKRLGVNGGDTGTVVRITLPSLKKLAVAGSGRITADRLAPDGKISVAGSGRIEVANVTGGHLAAHIAGSGRLTLDGKADELSLHIAGSGSCDAEGLVVDKASVHIAGSGDAIFACDGEVDAHLMGSGNVIIRGSARCNVQSFGSGTVTCEREREASH